MPPTFYLLQDNNNVIFKNLEISFDDENSKSLKVCTSCIQKLLTRGSTIGTLWLWLVISKLRHYDDIFIAMRWGTPIFTSGTLFWQGNESWDSISKLPRENPDSHLPRDLSLLTRSQIIELLLQYSGDEIQFKPDFSTMYMY